MLDVTNMFRYFYSIVTRGKKTAGSRGVSHAKKNGKKKLLKIKSVIFAIKKLSARIAIGINVMMGSLYSFVGNVYYRILRDAKSSLGRNMLRVEAKNINLSGVNQKYISGKFILSKRYREFKDEIYWLTMAAKRGFFYDDKSQFYMKINMDTYLDIDNPIKAIIDGMFMALLCDDRNIRLLSVKKNPIKRGQLSNLEIELEVINGENKEDKEQVQAGTANVLPHKEPKEQAKEANRRGTTCCCKEVPARVGRVHGQKRKCCKDDI